MIDNLNNIEELIYTFYPKGIDALNNPKKYIESLEHKNLLDKINSKGEIQTKSLRNECENLSLRFDDYTLFDWYDRCYNFQLSEISENNLYKIHINISIISPFYFIFLSQTHIDENGKHISITKRILNQDLKKYHVIINHLSRLIEDEIGYKKFNEKYLAKVISDVNFQDIEMGKFTYYNAFFLNDLTE